MTRMAEGIMEEGILAGAKMAEEIIAGESIAGENTVAVLVAIRQSRRPPKGEGLQPLWTKAISPPSRLCARSRLRSGD
jgi:hypothetical protein